MRNCGWAFAVLLMAGGCQGGRDDGVPETGQTAAAAVDPASAQAEASGAPGEAVPVATGRSVAASNDLYEFGFSYPDAAGAIPQLRDMFDAQLVRMRSRLAAAAREDQATARKDGYQFNPHSYSAAWDTVADLPDWLSLSAQIATYSGGAHGMSNFDSMLWDRRTQAVLKPRDLFASTDALRVALREPFCDALDRERETRRGEPVQRDSEQMFSECIDPVAQTLILGSTNGRTFDRIGILVAPYEAGPYAEGSYEVTLPVTDRVMAVLKPPYRGSFSVGR